MDDPILPNEPQAPAAPAAPAAPDRLDRLESAMLELSNTVRDAAARVTSAPPPQAPVTPDEFMNRLATDPQGTIRSVAQEAFRQAADQNLNPAVSQVLEMSAQNLLQSQEYRIDSEFGVGTFEEMFKPQIEQNLRELRTSNPRAVADPNVVGALVDRVAGQRFAELMDRRRIVEQAERKGGASHLVPRGSTPRLRSAAALEELPMDVEGFLKDVERATGETVDRKSYAKLYHTGQDSGPGRHRTSLLDYLRAINAPPEKIKAYGG